VKVWNKLAGVMALSLGLTSFTPTASALDAPTGELTLTKIAGYSTGAGIAEAGAEIVSYDWRTQTVYLINGATSSFEIVDLSGMESGTYTNLSVDDDHKISIKDQSPDIATNPDAPLFGDVTSIAVHPDADLIAASVPNSDKIADGSVVFFSKAGQYLGHVRVGALPDMITVTTTPDGENIRFLVANEGEPDSEEYIRAKDPEGSVSIIDLLIEEPEGASTLIETGDGVQLYAVVATARFTDLSSTDAIDENVRYGALTGYIAREELTLEDWAKDFEPEFISVTEDGLTAYVVLQESNAIGVLDLNTKKFTGVYGLGYKNYMLPENALDP